MVPVLVLPCAIGPGGHLPRQLHFKWLAVPGLWPRADRI